MIHSQQLSDADLVENAATKSQNHLFAIARRLKLSECVTDVLVERGNRKVIHKVAANAGARFSLAGYDKLTHRARRDRKLTLALARRRDLPRQYFLKLLETAQPFTEANVHAPAHAQEFTRQGRGHDPHPRQGGRLLLDNRQGIAADVRGRT